MVAFHIDQCFHDFKIFASLSDGGGDLTIVEIEGEVEVDLAALSQERGEPSGQ